jgi:hypothetical protein
MYKPIPAHSRHISGTTKSSNHCSWLLATRTKRTSCGGVGRQGNGPPSPLRSTAYTRLACLLACLHGMLTAVWAWGAKAYRCCAPVQSTPIALHTHETNTQTLIDAPLRLLHKQAEASRELATIRATEEERLAEVLAKKQHDAERQAREIQRLREQSAELRE